MTATGRAWPTYSSNGCGRRASISTIRERWTVEATDDVGDGSDAGLGPLTLEVDAWIGAVRRRPAGCPPPTGRADVEALRRIGRARATAL
ncbi:MAG: hypothetical protein OXB99_07115 [Acidimicrobiaceae bacterium]|nr:hypothetical protein [Acidimicrobiaceae bacterium]